jgi:hypothetical protein
MIRLPQPDPEYDLFDKQICVISENVYLKVLKIAIDYR